VRGDGLFQQDGDVLADTGFDEQGFGGEFHLRGSMGVLAGRR
jgi:hypothetical protein